MQFAVRRHARKRDGIDDNDHAFKQQLQKYGVHTTRKRHGSLSKASRVRVFACSSTSKFKIAVQVAVVVAVAIAVFSCYRDDVEGWRTTTV